MNQFAIIWIITLMIKLFLSSVIPLSTDEAYYWVWSQLPNLSYFDHPPAVAWLFWIGNQLPQIFHSERWAGVLLGHANLIVWYFIWKNLFSNEMNSKKFWFWFYLVIFSPMLGLGSLILTPDIPVLFFWSLSILFAVKVFKNHRLSDYLWLGASLGAGFCSKYHIVLFIPCILAYVVLEKKWKEINYIYMVGTVVVGLIFCFPVLYWNYQHDFTSFRFQLNHGLSRPEYKFYWTWSYVAGQVLAIFPVIFYYFLRSKINQSARIIYYFAYVPLLFFLFSSFKALVEANWPIIAYPSVYILAALAIRSYRPVIITSAAWVLIYTLITLQSFVNWMPDPPEKLNEAKNLIQLSDKTRKYQPLYLSTYQMASYFWYTNNAPSYKLYHSNRTDFYDFLAESRPSVPTFYFLANMDTDLPKWITEDQTYKWEIIEQVDTDYRVFKVDRISND